MGSGQSTGDALEAAAEGGFQDVVETLVKHSAPLNDSQGIRQTPLETAASRGDANVVRVLLDNGAITTRDSMQAAVYGSNVGVLRLLLKKMQCQQDLPVRNS